MSLNLVVEQIYLRQLRQTRLICFSFRLPDNYNNYYINHIPSNLLHQTNLPSQSPNYSRYVAFTSTNLHISLNIPHIYWGGQKIKKNKDLPPLPLLPVSWPAVDNLAPTTITTTARTRTNQPKSQPKPTHGTHQSESFHPH